MDTPTRYESIPRTPGGPISGAPVGNRSWSARVAARLPHRTSVRSLLILSIAVVAVLGVSYFRRAPEYYRSLSWPDFSVQRFARIGYGYSKVDSLKASIAPDTLSFLSRGGGRGGGRCFRKCGKLPGPKVCCAHDGGTFRRRRNKCACECRGGTVTNSCDCACKKTTGKKVCCSTADGKITTSRKCCKCKPEGKVLSRGECPTEAPSSGLCDCPKVYEPVCCDTEDGPETYPNECVCESFGNEVISEGICEVAPTPPTPAPPTPAPPTPAPPTPAPPTPAPPTPAPPTPAPGPPESCPRIYEPFCCRTIYGLEVAPNRCECLRVGAFPLYDGACNKETCPCPSINAPVCCDTEVGPKTAFNECECRCDPQNDVISSGECGAVPEPTPAPPTPAPPTPAPPTPAPPTPAPPTPAPPTPAPPTPAPGPPESCPRIYEPFCCRTIYGLEVAPNRCECLRVGAFPLYDGACNKETCPCPSINAPVCCDTEVGPKTAFNECECRCDPQNDVISNGKCEA
ncbi:hypothetical protein FGB62_115g02 [Gracilaria domingensis]|nr:hypothetical protein FGB62_115g02 [Gracilaria domingensis]